MNFQIASLIGVCGVGFAALSNPSGHSAPAAPSAFATEMRQQCAVSAGQLGQRGCECFVATIDAGLDDTTRELMSIAIKHRNDRDAAKSIVRDFQAAGYSLADARDVQHQIKAAMLKALETCMPDSR